MAGRSCVGPAVGGIRPIGIMTPFLGDRSRDPIPLSTLASRRGISSLCFLGKAMRRVTGPCLDVGGYAFGRRVFDRYRFGSTRLASMHFRGYSLSGISFTKAAFCQMRFVSYGLLKANFPRTALGRILVSRYCKRCVGLSVMGVQATHFDRYGFQGNDLGSDGLVPTTFSAYRLLRTSFSRASLGNVSLEGSEVTNVRLGVTSLGKTVIDSLRTVSLLPLLKIGVRSS